MPLKCLVAMLKPNFTEKVVQAAKKNGATGATIIPASGTGVHEANTFFGLTLDVSTDVVIFILQEKDVDKIMATVKEAGSFDQPGTGIAFVVPVEQATGMESQTNQAEKKGD
jgi:nitrogen regulatory protein PII